jgi:hypothetical protein
MPMEIGDAADITTGALIARAVEPQSGESTGTREGRCLNCQAAIAGAYCSSCGQKVAVHRTLRGFGHDILHGVFHFDGKIWRTIPLLFLNPGQLTLRYIHGERAKFVSPIALFLFCVFLILAAFNSFTPVGFNLKEAAKGPQTPAEITQAKNEIRKEIDILRKRRQSGADAGERGDWIDDEIERQLENLTDLDHPNSAERTGIGTNINAHSKLGVINEAIKEASKNPELLLYKVRSNTYKFAWALIPISTPFIWLLFFWRREYKMFDHAVFVTYSLSFMMLLISASVVLELIPALETPVLLMMVLIPPFHIYRQIKQAYSLTRKGALWRTAATLLFALFAVSLFMGLIVTLGLVG